MKPVARHRGSEIKHPWALRASWIVLIVSLCLWVIGIVIPRTPGINWHQWTSTTPTSERTIAINTFAIWYMSFYDSSGQHQIFAKRPVYQVWNETVPQETLTDFRFMK